MIKEPGEAILQDSDIVAKEVHIGTEIVDKQSGVAECAIYGYQQMQPKGTTISR